jgi:hypothetical protein
MGAGALRRGGRCFERAEAARERDLRFVGHVLIAKDEHRMRLEGGANRAVGGVIVGDIGKYHIAHFCGKAGT